MSILPPFTVVRSFRKTIRLHITKDGRLEVQAPHLVPEVFIRQFVSQHTEWIEQHRLTIVKKKKYVEGERFLFLGIEYTLRFVAVEEITAANGILSFPRALQFRVQKELTAWYVKKAQTLIKKRVDVLAEEMEVVYNDIYFSDTSSKWGSCSVDNRLQFNWRLILAPMLVVEYVIVHELAHIREKNHKPQFWRIVERHIPSYKQQRLWLKTHGQTLFI